jgi:hypothetical protein
VLAGWRAPNRLFHDAWASSPEHECPAHHAHSLHPLRPVGTTGGRADTTSARHASPEDAKHCPEPVRSHVAPRPEDATPEPETEPARDAESRASPHTQTADVDPVYLSACTLQAVVPGVVCALGSLGGIGFRQRPRRDSLNRRLGDSQSGRRPKSKTTEEDPKKDRRSARPHAKEDARMREAEDWGPNAREEPDELDPKTDRSNAEITRGTHGSLGPQLHEKPERQRGSTARAKRASTKGRGAA